jgi:5-methylcytosine-specific restriction endonuclease McrA
MLHLHHIDGNKANNESNNLIWLCGDCHSRIHNDFSKYVSHKRRIRNYESESDGNIKIKLKELRDKWLSNKKEITEGNTL